MTTYKIPLAVWEDFGGGFAAVTVDGDAAEAYADNVKQAKDQIKQYLSWLYRERWADRPRMRDPQILLVRTGIRAEYSTDEQVFPAAEKVEVAVPCVWSQYGQQAYSCCLPTLNVSFHCYDSQSIAEIAADYIQRELGGLPPAALNRYLLPKSVQVDAVNVKLPRESKVPTANLVANLETVADPLGSRLFRRNISPAWGRSNYVQQVLTALRNKGENLLLVGDNGVGKTTILTEAIREFERQRRESKDNPPNIPHMAWLTSGARLIAGMQYLGQWEERCERVIDELAEIQGVLCVENLRELVTSGSGEPASSVAAFLAPYLERAELRVFAETTHEELEAIRNLLPGFDALFQVIHIEPFDDASAQKVLDKIVLGLAQRHQVSLTPEATNSVYRLFKRFMPYNAFPGTCTGFLEEVARRQRLQATSKAVIELRPADVVREFTHRTGLPDWMLRDELPLDPNKTLAWFNDRIIGQEHACQAATDLVVTFKSGLNDPQRPIGVQLFCGPTGVGKTQLAKSLSDYLFGSGNDEQDRLVRIDMSEYATIGSAERLLSCPDGQPSQLVERVRAQPFVVVLFDEIEKAGSEVFDVLLGLFDEGRLSDRFGRVTDFRSSIVVLTSNLGSQSTSPVGFGGQVGTKFEQAVRKFFRPELFNRLDEVVSFAPLSASAVDRIATKELTELTRREGLVRRGISIAWNDQVVRLVSENGFDIRYGARPLQRMIEQAVVAPVAHWLAARPDATNVTLRLDVDGDSIVIR